MERKSLLWMQNNLRNGSFPDYYWESNTWNIHGNSRVILTRFFFNHFLISLIWSIYICPITTCTIGGGWRQTVDGSLLRLRVVWSRIRNQSRQRPQKRRRGDVVCVECWASNTAVIQILNKTPLAEAKENALHVVFMLINEAAITIKNSYRFHFCTIVPPNAMILISRLILLEQEQCADWWQCQVT